MVLTAAQRTAFFENADQMGIPHDTFVQMAQEGIDNEDDIADFDEDSIKQMAENLRRPPGGAQAFAFGAKSHKRLVVAGKLIRYYNTVGRDLTAANLRWDTTMKNFAIQWKALEDRVNNDDDLEVPKITKTLPIIKWSEAFKDFLGQKIGLRTIPLIYITREPAEVPVVAPPLANGQPHSTRHGSVEAELIARASHTHALYRDDNGKLYYYLEVATRGTQYAASIKPYQRARNGRSAWQALINQYCGQDKWEAEIKKQEQLLHTRKWKAQSNYSLESFIASHRNAYVSMEACAQHVKYQLPNEHSRVGFLLDGIECSDAGLQAAMASVRTDDGPNGKRNNFEMAATHLLPYDPVMKRRSEKRRHANISSTICDGDDTTVRDEAEISSTNSKPSIGKTGVHLRYHKRDEYRKLTAEQRSELHEWRASLPDGHPSKTNAKGDRQPKKQKKQNKYMKKQVSSIVAKSLAPLIELLQDKEENKKAESYVVSVVEQTLGKHGIGAPPAAETKAKPSTKPSVDLKSILKAARRSAKSE